MDHRKPILIAAFLAFFHAPSQAAERVEAANLAGMGGASVAASEDNSAVTVNPGLLSLHERYDMHGHYQFGPDSVSRWGASVVDSRTSKWLTGGFYYAGDVGSPPLALHELPGWTVPGETPSNVRKHHNLTMAWAVQGWDRRFGVGISGTWAIWNHDLQGRGSTANLDAGLGVRPTDWLDVGVAGRNLVPIDDIGVLPMAVAGGLRLHGRPGALLGDLEWREDVGERPVTIRAGGEVPFGDTAVVRSGYRYEAWSGVHRVTGGLALGSETGSLDLGVQVPVAPETPTFQGLALGVSIHLAAPESDSPSNF